MSKTEELRRLLDERGVEHQDYEYLRDSQTTWSRTADGWGVRYVEYPSACTLSIYNCTPEQAIAATLGGDERLRDAEMQITVLKEQLRVANEAHCATCVDCGTPLSEELRCTKCAATLGGGECEMTLDGTDGCFGCSECLENIPPLANYCPNCGRKVKR